MCEEAELGSFDLNLASGLNFFFFFFCRSQEKHFAQGMLLGLCARNHYLGHGSMDLLRCQRSNPGRPAARFTFLPSQPRVGKFFFKVHGGVSFVGPYL